MAKSKAELMAQKMKEKRVGEVAFEAGKKPIVEIETVDAADLPQDSAETVQEPQEIEQEGISTPEDEKPAVEQETAKNEEPEQVTEAQEQDIISTFFAEIEPEKREERETYSVHTTVAVRKELDKRAKQAKMSRGAYLDKLLKRAFGIS